MNKIQLAIYRSGYLHGANKAIGAGFIIHPMLGQTKVCHFDVALAVQEHILLGIHHEARQPNLLLTP